MKKVMYQLMFILLIALMAWRMGIYTGRNERKRQSIKIVLDTLPQKRKLLQSFDKTHILSAKYTLISIQIKDTTTKWQTQQ